MPVAGQRDPEVVHAVLEQWLGTQVGRARVEVSDLVVPQASGFSNETFLFNAALVEGGPSTSLVLRSQPHTHALFPEIDLIEQQYTTMKLLREHSNVPVAEVLWAERDTSVLGNPFFVMKKLDGVVPGDNPPYMIESFVVDMTPDQRNVWHRAGVEAMTRVGRVDWPTAGFQHLDKAHHGRLGSEQRRGYFGHFVEWATHGEHHPVVHPAFEKLLTMWPADDEHINLCWGDARPGNQMSNGPEIVGVFDWEMVSLGNCESDLGWWIFLQRYSSEGVGAPLLDGLLTRAETIAEWEHHMGRTATHVDFYEALAGLHFSLVMVKLAEMMEFPEMSFDNPVATITKELLGLS